MQEFINTNEKGILYFYSSVTGNFQGIMLTCEESPKIPGKATNSSSCLFLEREWQRSMLSSSEVRQFREAEHEWMSLEGFQIRTCPVLALTAARSFGSPEEAEVQPLAFPVRALFCSTLCREQPVFLTALSSVCRCSLATQELVPTRPLKLL